MSDVPLNKEKKNKKCSIFGNKYFFCSGKCSINKKPLGFPFYLIIFSYDFCHTFYYIYKLINLNIFYLIILLIFTVVFILQLIQTLLTTLVDPGSFLPNTGEDNSNSSEVKLMIATIKQQDYFLKYCSTCKIARDLRVYHCPECGLCILRHDHHCPWLSTCIGLNNHKHFILLIIINLLFSIGALSILLFFLIIFNNTRFTIPEIIFIYFLLFVNLCIFLFHIVLIINHAKYICTGQTTREKIKRSKGAKNPFLLPTKCDNMKEFWESPMKYKERVVYNDKAKKFLDNNILINDYLSGNYRITKNKKIISLTLINNGFNYSKGTIEMAKNEIKEDDIDEEETSQSIKVEEEPIDTNNNISTDL